MTWRVCGDEEDIDDVDIDDVDIDDVDIDDVDIDVVDNDDVDNDVDIDRRGIGDQTSYLSFFLHKCTFGLNFSPHESA